MPAAAAGQILPRVCARGRGRPVAAHHGLESLVSLGQGLRSLLRAGGRTRGDVRLEDRRRDLRHRRRVHFAGGRFSFSVRLNKPIDARLQRVFPGFSAQRDLDRLQAARLHERGVFVRDPFAARQIRVGVARAAAVLLRLLEPFAHDGLAPIRRARLDRLRLGSARLERRARLRRIGRRRRFGFWSDLGGAARREEEGQGETAAQVQGGRELRSARRGEGSDKRMSCHNEARAGSRR